MILDAEIQGIPCKVKVTHYTAEEPAIITGSADHWEEGSPAEIDFDVLDQRGRPAPWLERKMLSEDTRAIEQEIIEAKRVEREDAAELAFDEWGAYA